MTVKQKSKILAIANAEAHAALAGKAIFFGVQGSDLTPDEMIVLIGWLLNEQTKAAERHRLRGENLRLVGRMNRGALLQGKPKLCLDPSFKRIVK